MKILVITEIRQGKWNNASFETLAAAQQIAAETSSTVSALVIGNGFAAFADELAAKDVAEVLLVEHDLLEAYTCLLYTSWITAPDRALRCHPKRGRRKKFSRHTGQNSRRPLRRRLVLSGMSRGQRTRRNDDFVGDFVGTKHARNG